MTTDHSPAKCQSTNPNARRPDDYCPNQMCGIWGDCVLKPYPHPAPKTTKEFVETFKLGCWCTTCRPINVFEARFVVCPECGDKRCVHAKNHEAPCAKVDLFAHNHWVERFVLDALHGKGK